jgi:hypothetical protein
MFEILLAGFFGGVCAWFFTDFVTKPLRRFFDLCREINRCLVRYGNVPARWKWIDDNTRQELQISPEDDARLMEAHNAFRNLAADMRAFANVERFANQITIYFLGYDADKIASALIGYSNTIFYYGKPRSLFLDEVQRLLRISAVETPRTAHRSWFPFRRK